MRTPGLICCAALSLVMLGCNPEQEQKATSIPQPPAPAMVAQADAAKPPGPKAKKAVGKKCKKDDCDIEVNVTDACVVSVNHESVGVTKGIDNVPIRWTLVQHNKFDFTSKGVELKRTSPSFPRGSVSNGGKTFTIIDKNQGPDDEEFPYSVFVKRKNGADCPVLDPTIINGY